MRRPVRKGLVLASVMLLLTAACSDDDEATTTQAAGPSSSVPVVTTTIAPTTTTPATTVPAGPAVVEAGGWRLVISAPTRGATIGSAVDLCYEATGPADAGLAFEVSLVLAATGTVAAMVRTDATVGRGSARLNLGTPDPRRYDMTVQGIVNGQRINGLTVAIGINFGIAAPAGCG